MKIGEFFVQLGVNANTKTIKEFVGQLGNMTLEAAGAVAAIHISNGTLLASTPKMANRCRNDKCLR
jgi:hypothetical protein